MILQKLIRRQRINMPRYETYLVINSTNIRMMSWISQKPKGSHFTLSASPWAAARALALWAWTGLRVMPWHLAPYFLARYLELPPIPHPTSTRLLGLFVGSSANQFRRRKKTSRWKLIFIHKHEHKYKYILWYKKRPLNVRDELLTSEVNPTALSNSK